MILDMQLIRGSCLTGFDTLAAECGGDPAALLTLAGVEPRHAGQRDRYVPLRSAITAVEHAASVLGVIDFGRKLAAGQTIDILGPVGVAARTATTVAEAFSILDTHMGTYSPGIAARIHPGADAAQRRFEYDFLLRPPPPQAQAIELSLGVTLRILHLFLGTDYRPVAVHVPHPALGPETAYRTYFGCPPRFNEPIAGFTLRTSDLQRRLHHDPLAHQLALNYLTTNAAHVPGVTDTVRSIVRQLLPAGNLTADLVARQFGVHPKTLQRRLVAEGTTYAALVDRTRRDIAHRLLANTSLPISHVARQVGYAEHSVFTRACKRWFTATPSAYRGTQTATPEVHHG